MLIRVILIPKSSGNFHFNGAESQAFKEVDWFRDESGMMETEDGRTEIANFIKQKNYFNPTFAYLVLHQEHTFTIGYSAP